MYDFINIEILHSRNKKIELEINRHKNTGYRINDQLDLIW